MVNQVTIDGLELETIDELITKYTNGMKAIYGADINLDQDTPDGQQMMLILQMVIDLYDTLREIYNSFDPDNAIGVSLDKRIAFNGIQRLGGTFTITNISIVVDRALSLDGLNTVGEDDAYKTSDDSGNEWILIDDEVFAAAGTQVAAFRAVNAGKVLTTINTITTPVTITLGVTSVNNPATYTTLGIDEESDFTVRIRRGKAVSRASQGYLPSLRAELENIVDIGSVKTYENKTSAIDANGVTPHSIWVIVSGSAAPSDIATAIYKKRSSGCNMFGVETYIYTEVDGKLFTVKWDNVVTETLFIKFDVSSIDGINPPLDVKIADELPGILSAGIGASINTNDLVEKVKSIDSNALVTGDGFSLVAPGPYTPLLTPSSLKNQFEITTPNIAITVI